MPAPLFSAAAFRQAMHALLPTGRIWPREEGTVQVAVLGGLAPVYERSATDAGALLGNAFPTTALGLLPEWESTLGLEAGATMQQRRGAVLAQLIGVGGQSVPTITAYAAAMGITIAITQYAPARAGFARAGDSAQGAAWAYHWRVNGPAGRMTFARAGRTATGEPVVEWGDLSLEIFLRRIAAAHTTVSFAYTSTTAWDEGNTTWDGGATVWDPETIIRS